MGRQAGRQACGWVVGGWWGQCASNKLAIGASSSAGAQFTSCHSRTQGQEVVNPGPKGQGLGARGLVTGYSWWPSLAASSSSDCVRLQPLDVDEVWPISHRQEFQSPTGRGGISWRVSKYLVYCMCTILLHRDTTHQTTDYGPT